MVDPVMSQAALDNIEELVALHDYDAAADLLRALHPADAAEILASLDDEEQSELVQRLDSEQLADVFEQMNEGDMAEVAEHLDHDVLVDVLDQMEPDIAADLLGELEPDQAAELIEEMDEAAEVASLLQYPEESAGGIMNVPPPSLRRWMKAREAVAYIRENYQDAEEIYYLYVLDRNGMLIGLVNLRALVLADPDQTIESIMRRDVISVRADADQEEAAQILSRYDLLAVPVVDVSDRLVGIITVDDLVDVIEEEATEDIYHLAQVGADSELFSPIPQSLRNRLPWLVVNLGTALLASFVVSLFDSTIAQVTILAAFLPIVAGQGGNAGTQTMTVVVRSLALREVEPRDTPATLWHEFLIGLTNGLVLGTLVGVVIGTVTHNPYMGLAIGLAMLGNMIVASTFGTLVPMTLKTIGVDPALASSIFVTTATDCFGFVLFLGIATLLLDWLT
jgi:magnesium transporter